LSVALSHTELIFPVVSYHHRLLPTLKAQDVPHAPFLSERPLVLASKCCITMGALVDEELHVAWFAEWLVVLAAHLVARTESFLAIPAREALAVIDLSQCW
jgi:hypothetical protein